MNHCTQSSNRDAKTFIAGLLAYVLLTSQLAPMALAFSGSAVRNAPAKTAETTRPLQKAAVALTSNDRKNQFAPVPAPLAVSPAILAPSITATKVDTYPSAPGDAQPGELITYSITITNGGPDPATNVTLNDTVDVNTAIVGTPKSTPIGFDDAYGVIGNVRIQVPDGTSDLLANDRDPDTDTNAGLTITTLAGDTSAPFAGTSAQGGQVTATTGDGSFQYNPAPGFTSADTFTYTVTDSDGGTSNGIVTLTVTGLIWFVQAGAAAGGDGRLTSPFNCFVGTNCFDDTTLDDPGDNIFLYSGNYIGGQTLLNNQRLIGQGATDTLANIGGVTVPAFSDPLPSTGGASPIITTAVAATNGVPLGQGNLLRGFTVGNTTGAKISGSGFGTLTVGDNSSPDIILNGTGRALNLTNGTFAATSGFTSVTTTSSGTQGISLAGVAGTVSFGSTTVSGATSQGILVGTTTADINFGNTSVSGGTIGISLQNNSAGTRTFSTLSVSNNSGVGFLHAVGGGNVNVTGATSIPAAAQTAPVGTGIDIQSLAVGTTVTFAATTVNKGNAGTGVNLGAAATPNAGNVTFNSLAITTANGSGLVGTGNTGQINVTTNAGSISSTNGPGINITKAAAPATAISLNFSTVSSTNSGTNGINLGRVSGNMTITTTTVANPTGIGIQVQNTSAGGTMTFGNTTANQSGGTGVFMNTNAGGVTFGDLDISPDSGQRALQSTNSTGTITSTSGDVTATSNVTFQVFGLNAATPTPLAMVLNNLDSTNSIGIGVDLNFVSGNLMVNDATLATNISNPTGIGLRVQNTAASGTMNFGNTNVTQSGGTGVSLSTNGGGVAFADLDISPDSGQRALQSTNSTGTITSTSGDVTATSNVTFQIFGLSAASRTPLAMVLNNLDSTNSLGIGVDLNFVSGNLMVNDATLATNISNPTGIGLRVQNTAAGGTMNFGNTNVTQSGGTGVFLSTNGGGVAFADLDISPDSGQRALQSTNSTGTITSTSGDVTATSNVTFQIFGLNAASLTPLAMVLNNLDSTDSIGIGVDLNFVSGNLTVNDATLATNITNPTGIGIRVQNTAAGGTMNFGNTNVTQSGGTGVSLNANGGGVTFADMDISPDAAQRPFLATNNTGVITSTSGTITPQAGVIAVGITNAAGTVPLNMQLTSVSASGAANGIVLSNTSSSGSPGGFIVNGDGTDTTVGGNGTGGTIANATGANGATAGNGVFLNNANGVTLRRMTINGTNQNHGIRGIGSSNVVLEFLTVAGSNGTSAAVDEGSVNFDNLLISAAITGCIISGGFEDNLNIVNTNGTLNRLTITNTTFGLNNSVSGANSILIQAQNAGTTLNFTLQSSTIKGARTDWINATSNSSSTMSAIIGGTTPALGNTFTNLAPDNNPGAVAGGNRVLLSSVGTLTFDINNNTLRGSLGEAIRVQTTAAGALTGTGNGHVRNNTIGIQATANSGSSASSGIHLFGDGGSDMTAAVTNNQVFQYNSHGILFTFGNEVNDGSVFDATVTGNTVNTPGNILSGFNGIHLNNGTVAATDNFTTCIDIGGTGFENNIVGSGNGAVSPNNQEFRLQQRQSTTVRLLGYGGANNNNAAVVAYIQGRNIVTAGNGAASNTVPTGGGYVNTAVQCTQPSAPVTLVADVTRPGDASGETSSTGASVQQVAAPSSTDSITARPFISSAQGTQGTTEAPVTTEAPATSVAKPETQTTVASRAPVPPVANNKPTQTAPPKSPDNPSATPPVIGPGGSSLTWNVGTLPAGRSVTITFTVQVENPYSGPPQVSNQGLVSFGGGGGPVLTDDPSVGGASDPTVTPVAPTPDVSIRDARVAEPTSGTTSMLFTVALSAPAVQLATIDYSTANGTAVEPGDYVAVATGSTTFQVGEQIKVIPITVNSDADATEVDENFTVTISANPTVANVVDATATGTITVANPPGTLLISELRTFGPGPGNDPNDDFVEIYNNTDSPIIVPAGGYGLFKISADCNATPLLVGTIPATTVIPARGHFLFTGSAYSLVDYGGATLGSGDAALTADLEDNSNLALFSTTDVSSISSDNRLDAVGFGSQTTNNCALLAEGNTLPALTTNLTSLGQHSFVRDSCGKGGSSSIFGPCPTGGAVKDSNDNAVDFFFVDANGTVAGAGQRLGAPGPENLTSPLQRDTVITGVLLEATVPAAQPPNRVRNLTPVTNGVNGTLSIRRRFTNITGSNVTKLRFRVMDITTFPAAGPSFADLRALTSVAVLGVTVNDSATCAATGTPATAPCTVTVEGTTLEEPPTQPNGGGFNSTLAAGTITMGTPLAAGASVNIQWLLGVQQSGNFKFFVIVEAVP